MPLKLKPPYLIFLGDMSSRVYAKTALGLVQWAPELCLAQHRFPECEVDIGLNDLSIRVKLGSVKLGSDESFYNPISRSKLC
jgi:hypothetical protein